MEQLPAYLKSAVPNPEQNRAPWYKNTAPSYAGIFLSVPFMAGMAGSLLYGSIWASVVGLIVGALFCFVLYYTPARLGMTTGLPLYVVGTSTFGTTGGILMPGLLMGILQIGWHAVFTFTAATFFMQAIGQESGAIFWGVCAVWGFAFAFVGAVGIQWLASLSTWIPILPLAMIVLAAFANSRGLKDFSMDIDVPAPITSMVPLLGLAAFATLQAAAGFFATAGAAGADFAMNSRNNRDLVMGGFVGITIAAVAAGVFSILAIAGAIGIDSEAVLAGKGGFDPFINSIKLVGGLAPIMFWIFVAACICPTGFCAFLAGNAFSTMFPKLPRIPLTLAAGAVGVVLAATGVASNLVQFFLIIGASFGPIIGAMTADALRSGSWPGPRKGVNFAGYIAWAVGFVVGILEFLPGLGFPYGLATLLSFIVGFAVYLILADLGMEPATVELPSGPSEQSAETNVEPDGQSHS